MMTIDVDPAALMRTHTAPPGSTNTQAPRVMSSASSTNLMNPSHASTSTLASVSSISSQATTFVNGGVHTPTAGDSPIVSSPGGNLLSAPVASDSIINKQADGSQSLYQICLNLKHRLKLLPGFDNWLRIYETDPEQNDLPSDPVYQLWHTFRLGAPLILLYNTLNPNKPLDGADTIPEALNEKKRCIFRFLKATNEDFSLSGDDSFIISHLYSDDTNGFVKVTKVVTTLLDEIEARGLVTTSKGLPGDRSSSDKGPQDKRAKVAQEFLDTERKYVQDLEALQDYMRAVQLSEVVSNDTIHALFLNLNALLDFQRRFLIRVETMNSLPPEQQRLGSLFTAYESAFGVYENFCANFKLAQELAVNEAPRLQKVDHPLGRAGLGGFLIKPPQRICKYPMLLKEMIKASSPDDPRVPDLEVGYAAIVRVNDRVNDAIRKLENAEIVEELKERVEDWKGHQLEHFGDLLLSGQFTVLKGDARGDVERDYHIYLFERILLCCKEMGTSKKQSKTMAMNNKKNRKKPGLQLKGRIFMQNVTDIVSLARNGSYTLQIFWKGDPGVENFTIRHRNEELLQQWNTLLHRQVELWRREDTSSTRDGHSRSSGVSKHTTSNTEFLWMNGADIEIPRVNEEDTTEDEDDEEEDLLPANLPQNRADSATGHRMGGSQNMFPPPRQPRYPMSSSSAYMQATNPSSLPNQSVLSTSASDRGVNSGSYFSPTESPLPTPMSMSSMSSSRVSSGTSQQYPFPRQGTPSSYDESRNGPYSPASMTRTSSREGAQMQMHSNQRMQRPSLPGITQPQNVSQQSRMRSASSPNIHNIPTTQTARAAGMHPPPMPTLPAGFSTYSSQTFPAASRSMTGSPGSLMHSGASRMGNQSPSMLQQMQHLSMHNEHPRTDSRSASTQMHHNQLQHALHQDVQGAPPLRNGTPPSLASVSHDANGRSMSTSTISTIATLSPRPPTVPSLKVKVSYVEDMFVIIVPQNIGFTQLMDRIERKVRLCGGATYTESSPLRVRYQDEDGDYITVNSDEDVQMAIESRFHGGDDNMGAVTLFVA